MSTSAQVTFKWLHIPLTIKQLAQSWLMSLSIDVALCVTGGCENGTDGPYFTYFSEDMAFAHHFMTTQLSPPCRTVTGSYASKESIYNSGKFS